MAACRLQSMGGLKWQNWPEWPVLRPNTPIFEPFWLKMTVFDPKMAENSSKTVIFGHFPGFPPKTGKFSGYFYRGFEQFCQNGKNAKNGHFWPF